jgi:DNA phosphorothioation-associated putative methyltransferase
MSIFDRSTQQDIRTLLGGYTKGIESGRALLFSAGRIDMVNSAMEVAKPGKLTASSFYVHRSGLNMLPPLLRVFEGCAHVLVGTVEGANVIKLRRREPRVSYLNYPKFDSEGHPALAASLLVDLRTFNASYREYCESPSPPILHRKELFVPATYPNRNSFVRLTAKEEALGLLNDDEEIGTRAGWLTAIESRGITIRGHRVYRLKRSDKRSDESTQN